MPSRDFTDVTLASEDHDGPDDHNDCDNPDYHDDHDKFAEDEDEDMLYLLKAVRKQFLDALASLRPMLVKSRF